MGTSKIEADGTPDFEFSHASDYVIVIHDKTEIADTGDNMNLIPICGIMLIMSMLIPALKKKNN